MRPLLIASLGNPGPTYLHTLHSAAHIFLSALQPVIPTSHFSKSDREYAPAVTSRGPDDNILLWQCPSFMNESGPALAAAWGTFCRASRGSSLLSADNKEHDISSTSPQLLIVHDELELPVGRYSIKTSTGTSARGHNGLKSVMSMPSLKACKLTRVGIGIGPRPESRDPDVVARYVLGKMSRQQKETMEMLAEKVWGELKSRGIVGLSPGRSVAGEARVSGGRRVEWR